MFVGQLLKEISHRPAFAAVCLFDPAADAAYRFEELLVIKEFLVGLCALDHYLGLAVHGENGRFAGLLQLANYVLGVSLEFAKRLNIGEVETHALNLHEIACFSKGAILTIWNRGKQPVRSLHLDRREGYHRAYTTADS